MAYLYIGEGNSLALKTLLPTVVALYAIPRLKYHYTNYPDMLRDMVLCKALKTPATISQVFAVLSTPLINEQNSTAFYEHEKFLTVSLIDRLSAEVIQRAGTLVLFRQFIIPEVDYIPVFITSCTVPPENLLSADLLRTLEGLPNAQAQAGVQRKAWALKVTGNAYEVLSAFHGTPLDSQTINKLYTQALQLGRQAGAQRPTTATYGMQAGNPLAIRFSEWLNMPLIPKSGNYSAFYATYSPLFLRAMVQQRTQLANMDLLATSLYWNCRTVLDVALPCPDTACSALLQQLGVPPTHPLVFVGEVFSTSVRHDYNGLYTLLNNTSPQAVQQQFDYKPYYWRPHLRFGVTATDMHRSLLQGLCHMGPQWLTPEALAAFGDWHDDPVNYRNRIVLQQLQLAGPSELSFALLDTLMGSQQNQTGSTDNQDNLALQVAYTLRVLGGDEANTLAENAVAEVQLAKRGSMVQQVARAYALHGYGYLALNAVPEYLDADSRLAALNELLWGLACNRSRSLTEPSVWSHYDTQQYFSLD
jgi:hypothetical protein